MEVAEVLGPEGLLPGSLPRFAYRSQQLAMAEAVDAALGEQRILVTEAGTGTGKTYAYLVPALLCGRKIIVSTGTRNLQDQLFHRDLPRLREALGVPRDTALLKGRSNYLCLHRLDDALQDRRARDRGMAASVVAIREWAHRTRRGDIAELTQVPENEPVWPLVTSTADNCLGTECPAYKDCYLVEARRRAQEADLVVINHHLLCADFALREEGFGELLPRADAFIIDEAHQLPDTATRFLGSTVSARRIDELVTDTEAEYRREAGDQPDFVKLTATVSKRVRDLRILFGPAERRGIWREVTGDTHLSEAVAALGEQLLSLHKGLEDLAGRGRGLQTCRDRAGVLAGALKGFTDDDPADDRVRWFELTRLGFRFNETPLDIAAPFRERMDRHAASWIFTSATLAVSGSFEHFQKQLGLDGAVTAHWDSPFDYERQGLWYVPRGLPEPAAPDYTEQVVERALPVIEACGGRTFLLFTSHRALKAAAAHIDGRLDYPLLVQGSAPRDELLRRFRDSGNAVLLGTGSFWEGVDVQGEALSCVVIDKLPFASPGDPVLQARLEAIRNHGGNAFRDYQLPQAVIALKQGAGRLIRGIGDRGVLMVCDPRLLKKNYGHVFLDAMPAFSRTRDLQDVQRFFAAGTR
ncbi:MAG: ATP-dependent DNA helicase [Pseudomonadota bacterium]